MEDPKPLTKDEGDVRELMILPVPDSGAALGAYLGLKIFEFSDLGFLASEIRITSKRVRCGSPCG
jgi:hypothetical protein